MKQVRDVLKKFFYPPSLSDNVLNIHKEGMYSFKLSVCRKVLFKLTAAIVKEPSFGFQWYL